MGNGCFLSSCPYKPPKPKCQKLRIPMGPNKQQCLTKCKQTSGCKSYRIQYGYSDQMKGKILIRSKDYPSSLGIICVLTDQDNKKETKKLKENHQQKNNKKFCLVLLITAKCLPSN